MPLVAVAAQNADLDANYGDGHAASWPDSFTVRLYDADPRNGGTEIAAGGVATWAALCVGATVWEAVELDDEVAAATYAAVTVANDSVVFPPAVNGAKTTEPIVIAGATIRLVIFHNDIE